MQFLGLACFSTIYTARAISGSNQFLQHPAKQLAYSLPQEQPSRLLGASSSRSQPACHHIPRHPAPQGVTKQPNNQRLRPARHQLKQMGTSTQGGCRTPSHAANNSLSDHGRAAFLSQSKLVPVCDPNAAWQGLKTPVVHLLNSPQGDKTQQEFLRKLLSKNTQKKIGYYAE